MDNIRAREPAEKTATIIAKRRNQGISALEVSDGIVARIAGTEPDKIPALRIIKCSLNRVLLILFGVNPVESKKKNSFFLRLKFLKRINAIPKV